MLTITTIAGGAPKPVFDRLGPVYERQTGNRLNALYDTMAGIKARVANGDALDVLLMPVGMLDDYERSGIVRPQGRAALAIIGLGVGVPAGAPVPDISTPDRLRVALKAAKAIVHAPPTATPSGAQSDKVIRELGLSDELAGRVIHRAGVAGGVAAIASGEATLGIFPKSEIANAPGVTLVSGFPASLQLNTIYGAAVTAASPVTEQATELIRFLLAPDSRKVWRTCGFDPPPSSGS